MHFSNTYVQAYKYLLYSDTEEVLQQDSFFAFLTTHLDPAVKPEQSCVQLLNRSCFFCCCCCCFSSSPRPKLCRSSKPKSTPSIKKQILRLPFRLPCLKFDHPFNLKKFKKLEKKLVTRKVLFIIYHLIKIKISIAKKLNKMKSQKLKIKNE
uniref:Uncharacterized protein n=1 Tax=Oryza brachyantha TaxID=4533 RepID=J3MNQ3_ORYBR